MQELYRLRKPKRSINFTERKQLLDTSPTTSFVSSTAEPPEVLIKANEVQLDDSSIYN